MTGTVIVHEVFSIDWITVCPGGVDETQKGTRWGVHAVAKAHLRLNFATMVPGVDEEDRE